jgi:hypothetical protein
MEEMNDQEFLTKYRLSKRVRELFDRLEASMDSRINEASDEPNPHYKRLKDHEPIAVMSEWLTQEQFTGFCLGNAIKYLGRYNAEGKKGGLRNIEKAMDYLRWLIDNETV